MALFTPKVHVTFIDHRTGDVIGETRMKATDLPESFAVDTTLNMGGEEWSVVSAVPESRAEYTKSRKLDITLSPIESIDPSTLRYSLPTICDVLPDAEATAVGDDGFLFFEDDWRQIEFVSQAHDTDIERELAAIRLIYANEAEELGFNNIHVRSVIGSPVRGPVPLEDLAGVCRECRRAELGYHQGGHRVAGGFAFFSGGSLVLFGVAAEDLVSTLCLRFSGGVEPDHGLTAALDRFAADHDLYLVDWCRCIKADPGSDAFAQVFGRS